MQNAVGAFLLHHQGDLGSMRNGTLLLILVLHFFFPENWHKSPENTTFPQSKTLLIVRSTTDVSTGFCCVVAVW